MAGTLRASGPGSMSSSSSSSCSVSDDGRFTVLVQLLLEAESEVELRAREVMQISQSRLAVLMGGSGGSGGSGDGGLQGGFEGEGEGGLQALASGPQWGALGSSACVAARNRRKNSALYYARGGGRAPAQDPNSTKYVFKQQHPHKGVVGVLLAGTDHPLLPPPCTMMVPCADTPNGLGLVSALNTPQLSTLELDVGTPFTVMAASSNGAHPSSGGGSGGGGGIDVVDVFGGTPMHGHGHGRKPAHARSQARATPQHQVGSVAKQRGSSIPHAAPLHQITQGSNFSGASTCSGKPEGSGFWAMLMRGCRSTSAPAPSSFGGLEEGFQTPRPQPQPQTNRNVSTQSSHRLLSRGCVGDIPCVSRHGTGMTLTRKQQHPSPSAGGEGDKTAMYDCSECFE